MQSAAKESGGNARPPRCSGVIFRMRVVSCPLCRSCSAASIHLLFSLSRSSSFGCGLTSSVFSSRLHINRRAKATPLLGAAHVLQIYVGFLFRSVGRHLHINLPGGTHRTRVLDQWYFTLYRGNRLTSSTLSIHDDTLSRQSHAGGRWLIHSSCSAPVGAAASRHSPRCLVGCVARS